MPELKRFERASVEISEDGLAELDQGRRNVFVPRPEIREVQLSYGLGSERPLIAGILGAALLVVGIWPIRNLYLVLTGGGVFQIETIGAAALIFLGLWLIHFAFRKRLHLSVRTANQRRKILFHGKVNQEDLAELLRAAEHDFGYPVQRSVSLEDLVRRGILLP